MNHKIQVLILEKDDKIREQIIDLIKQLGYHPIYLKSAQKTLDYLRRNKNIDLVILDLKTEGEYQINTGRTTKNDRPGFLGHFVAEYTLSKNIPTIISSENAEEFDNNFELKSAQFIDKNTPNYNNRLSRKISFIINRKEGTVPTFAYNKFIIKVDGFKVILNKDDILYVQADNGPYIKLYTTSKQKYCLSMTLKDFIFQFRKVQGFANENFLKVHKSYFVNLKAVVKYNKDELYLEGTNKIIPFNDHFISKFEHYFEVFKTKVKKEYNILILEDNDEILMDITENISTNTNWKPIPVSNLEEARYQLSNLFIDVAVLDIKIDDHDLAGVEFAQEIKKKGDIPVIFLSGYVGGNAEKIIKAANAIKPFDIIEKGISDLDKKIPTIVHRALHRNLDNIVS